MRLRRSALALALYAAASHAGDGDRRLAFAWAEPAANVACELTDTEHPAKHAQRFVGVVDRRHGGAACVVEIPRKRFDVLYRFCTVAYVESLPREHYACWVQYSAQSVAFHYSYSADSFGAPPCAFACAAK